MLTMIRSYYQSLKNKEEGVTMIEYGLLAALIAVALIVTIVLVKDALEGTFSDVATGLNNT